MNIKLSYVSHLFLVILLIFMYFNTISLKKTIKKLDGMHQQEVFRRVECETSLLHQNAEIEQFKIDLEKQEEQHKKAVAAVENQLKNRKKEIAETVEKNPTCERQLAEIMKDQEVFFYGNKNM